MKKSMKKAPSPVGGKGARGVKDKDKGKSAPKRTMPPGDKPSMPQTMMRNVLAN